MNQNDLVLLDPIEKRYLCMMKIKGKSMKVTLKLQKPGSSLLATVSGGPAFEHVRKELNSAIVDLTSKDLPLDQFLNDLKALLEGSVSQLPSLLRYKNLDTLLKHLQDIGWSNLTFGTRDSSEVQLRHVDYEQRTHQLTVVLPPDYPDSLLTIETPIPMVILPEESKSLVNVFESFKETVEDPENQALWAELDEIDRNALVLGDTEGDAYYNPIRQIVVGEKSVLKETSSFNLISAPNVVAYIELNPKAPRNTPECFLYGPNNLIGEYKERYAENCENWNEEVSVMDNLKSSFGVFLPTPYSEIKNLSLECGICLAVGDNNSSNIYCCNENCGKLYHSHCLELLLSKDEAGTTVGKSFHGKCTFCNYDISKP